MQLDDKFVASTVAVDPWLSGGGSERSASVLLLWGGSLLEIAEVGLRDLSL